MTINWDLVHRINYYHVMELFSDAVEIALKELLEKKHLYQRITVLWPGLDVIGLKGSAAGTYEADDQAYWGEMSERLKSHLWFVTDEMLYRGGSAEDLFREPVLIQVKPFTIKIYCQVCEEVNPFNFQEWKDIFEEHGYWDQFEKASGRQVFYFKYQCQGCKSRPVIFLVQREGLKIWQAGRIPMETVLIPKFIPKDFSKYYSSALVAFNSGQVLPAKFMFRVFLEQYVRSAVPDAKSRDIEELFTAYKKSLSEIFNQQAPSLETIYDELSDHIHAADETPALIDQVRKDIDLHFEAKELFSRLPKK